MPNSSSITNPYASIIYYQQNRLVKANDLQSNANPQSYYDYMYQYQSPQPASSPHTYFITDQNTAQLQSNITTISPYLTAADTKNFYSPQQPSSNVDSSKKHRRNSTSFS